MVSFNSCAWFSVLKPASCQYPSAYIHSIDSRPPLLLYMKASLTITVRPFAVVNCLAFPRVSLNVPASLTCPLGPTPPGMRSTWLARKSSEPLRSIYHVFDSLSRDVSRTSVVGTRRTYIVHFSRCTVLYTGHVLRGAVLAGTGWEVHYGKRPVRRDSGREAFNRHEQCSEGDFSMRVACVLTG